MSELRINSDFTDFYDKLSKEDSLVTYSRYLSDCKQRGIALGYLRSLGVKTIDIHPVNSFTIFDGNIVVYTNPMSHGGAGKKIMTVTAAQRSYLNCIASKYIEAPDPISIKYLQIGKRRINIYFRKTERYTLDPGDIIDIQEMNPEYNRLIALPIYSIDYISDGGEMRATDFNEVQKLDKLNLNGYISEREIIQEIRDSILIYNKA